MANHIQIDNRRNHVVDKLTATVDLIAALPAVSSAGDGTEFPFGLILYDLVITPVILTLLIQMLNLPLPKLPTATSTTDRKWEFWDFEHCRVMRRATTMAMDGTTDNDDEERYCSPADLRRFAAMLTRRTLSLEIENSPEFLGCLLDDPNYKLENDTLFLDQVSWSAEECAAFGHLVQRSVLFKHLKVVGPANLEDPQILMECLSNSTHLQSIRISERPRHNEFLQREPALIDILVHDVVGPLLRNPQSQLKKLDLAEIHLEDHHFMVIVEALPVSKLEELIVEKNNVQCQSVLQFAQRLPKIKYLKRVALGPNPWEKLGTEFEECWKALVQGLLENVSIQSLNTWEISPEPETSLANLYCYLNWTGRHLLATSSTVPLGLWPLILERAGKNDEDDWSQRAILPCDEPNLKYDAIYMFLQKSPILSSILSSYSLKNRPRKKSKDIHL